MNIYWYWPHAHRVPSALAAATLAPGDSLVVQALAKHRGEPLHTSGYPYRVVRDLPARQPAARECRARRLLGALAIDVRRGVQRRRLLREVHPDVVHLQLLRFATDWLDLPGLARRHPVLAVVHDVVPHDRLLPRDVEDLLHRRLYRPACTPHLLVFHASIARLLEERYGVEPDRIHRLPLPVVPAAGSAAAARADGGRTVLFLGTLRENKGVVQYLRALEELGPLSGVSFHIAGAGPPRLEEAVREAGRRLPGVTAEIGRFTEERKRELLAGASIVVLPYTSDFGSQSGVLMDAYAHGVPVIASDVGCLGASIREEGTGWLADPDARGSLRDTIARALGDWEGYVARQVGVQKAAAAHDVSVVGPMLRRVYAHVAGEGR